jgi:hypothetical protein
MPTTQDKSFKKTKRKRKKKKKEIAASITCRGFDHPMLVAKDVRGAM